MSGADGRPARVGIAGVGGVASYAHIPAYRRLGVSVVLLYDNAKAAIDSATRALGRTARDAVAVTDFDELVAILPELDLDVLDVAVPSPAHHGFIAALLESAGGLCPPLLAQKPLADTRAAAGELVAAAAAAGVPLGVNVTARWVPTFRRARELVRAGACGEDLVASLTNRGWNPKDGVDWRSRLPRLIGFEMAVHHVDLLTWMLGPVEWVFAALRRVRGLRTAGDNVGFGTFGFASGAVANVVEDWSCRDRAAWHFHPLAEELVVSGSQATVVATPAELRLTTDGAVDRRLAGAKWFPDAFAGPMAEFLLATREGRRSEIDAASHLAVLDVLEALYESSERRSVVTLDSPVLELARATAP